MTKQAFQLDTDKLSSYLENHIEGYTGPLSAKKFSDGQSNPTYLLSTPNKQYVLRRQPPGKLLKGAHAVDREFKVMSALRDTSTPVAKALHLCTDAEIIGSMFYIMEFKDGNVYWDPSLPNHSAEERQEVYASMVATLSGLHKVNVDQVGLSDYGMKTEYFARQVHTWTKNYTAAETKEIAEMNHLIKWLPENMPEDDGLFSIVHGDYRLDNLMFAKDKHEVIAILDWELSTIGHPYADLAYQCMLYHLPTTKEFPSLGGVDIAALNIPNEEEYVKMYCQHMGFSEIPNWNFYLAFSLFRLAAICQGIIKRAELGNASSDKAGSYGDLVTPLASTALSLALR